MKNEPGDFDILRNKELIELENKFDELVSTIENNHKEYFEKRPARYADEKHDRLQNHFNFHQHANTARILFLEKSDLDGNIRLEVENAFKKLFGQEAR